MLTNESCRSGGNNFPIQEREQNRCRYQLEAKRIGSDRLYSALTWGGRLAKIAMSVRRQTIAVLAGR